MISQVILLTNDLLRDRHIDSVNCWKVLRIKIIFYLTGLKENEEKSLVEAKTTLRFSFSLSSLFTILSLICKSITPDTPQRIIFINQKSKDQHWQIYLWYI